MLLFAFLAQALAASPARIEPSSVPATGESEAIVTVESFGRYAIAASSSQGVALQLVDRMTGPGPIVGVPGELNGRVDVFLERGEYKVRTSAHKQGEGTAALEVLPFDEQNGPRPKELVELRDVTTSLRDLQARSWWIRIEEPRSVAIEAAGRHLADLRLWRDGSWLVDASPTCTTSEPVVGQPLTDCQLATRLPAGLYLVTAYGGPGQAWAETSSEAPLYLRYGVPELPAELSRRLTVSPFGTDRYKVPGTATWFRLELPKPATASISVRAWDELRPFRSDGNRGKITDESRMPVADVSAGRANGFNVVTISGTLGQPYLLQYFQPIGSSTTLPIGGPAWVGTIHSGHASDNPDVTPLIVQRHKDGTAEVVQDQALHIGGDQGYLRRFNLSRETTLFFYVEKRGEYVVQATELPVRHRLEPYLTNRPKDYKTPDRQGNEGRWDLDKGYYVLSLQPEQDIGVVTLRVQAASLLGDLREAVGADPSLQTEVRRGSASFASVDAPRGVDTLLVLNSQPDVQVGLVRRALPVDLSAALPFERPPETEVTIPATIPEPGRLVAISEQGLALQIRVDDGEWQTSPKVSAGRHSVQLRHPSLGSLRGSVWLEPTSTSDKTPLPDLPDAALAEIPDYEDLTDSRARYLDLERGASATYDVVVDEPGLYELQSTGLLATSGKVRTRTNVGFAEDGGNGSGRNFLVQRYLREGDYQLTTTAQGRSTGRLGLELRHTRLLDGGALALGLPARAELQPGEGVVYTFQVREAGRYRLAAMGQDRGFTCRLEDAEGWPLDTPGIEADLQRWFEPGTYRLVLLPDVVPSRRLTSFERLQEPTELAGHGPHELPLFGGARHIWWEPQPGEDRVPDTWAFTLPAAATATLALSGQMHGVLTAEGMSEPVARIGPGSYFRGPLEAGNYRIEVLDARRDNGVDYRITLSTAELIAGTSRELEAPARVPLAVGAGGLVELQSAGRYDVKARLYDDRERLVAANDDRPEDWNFQLLQRLPPGRYSLVVDPVGRSSAPFTVSMSEPEEHEDAPMASGEHRTVTSDGGVLSIPLDAPGPDRLLTASLSSTETIGAAIETLSHDAWQSLDTATGRSLSLAVRTTETPTRLRLWSLDGRGNPVEVAVAADRPGRANEGALARGTTLRTIRGSGAAGLVVELDHPGTFDLKGGPDDLRWCPRAGSGCIAIADAILPLGSRELWLVAGPSDQREAVRAERRVLAGELKLELPNQDPAAVDLVGRQGGPVLVLATAAIGQPGLLLSEAGTSPERMASAVDLGPGRISAVSLRERDPLAVLWSAGASPADGIGLKVQAFAFDEPAVDELGLGPAEGTVPAGGALAFTLPAEHRQLDLVLARGLVGAVDEDGRVTAVRHAVDRPLQSRLVGEERELVLLNPTEVELPFSVVLAPTAQPSHRVAGGAPAEIHNPAPGVLEIPVAPTDGPKLRTVHVRGAARQVSLIEPSGRIWQGSDLDIGPLGGTLLIRHEPGLVLAWVTPRGDDTGPWTDSGGLEPHRVLAPEAVSLSGPAQRIQVTGEGPGVIHLTTPTPYIVRVLRDGAPPVVAVRDRGGSFDFWLQDGVADISLRGIGGASLTGVLDVARSEAIELAEGLGPEVLLAPGMARYFRFTVDRQGPVGAGVRVDADVVQARLMDTSGSVVSEGVVQMADLSPGTWLLALSLPADAAPVRARPALAGVEPPDTGPPAEVIKGYLELAGLAPGQE